MHPEQAGHMTELSEPLIKNARDLDVTYPSSGTH